MTWGKLLEPNLVLPGTVLSLTPEILQQHHLGGLVLDVDETLVPVRSVEASEALIPWISTIRQVAKLWLLSNNLSEARIGRIARALDVPYISGAAKPSRRHLRRVVAAMELPVEQVAMVGDRLFTDVLAGNRLGLFTILVQPMVDLNSTPRRSSLHNFEVWLSQALGASIFPHQ